jgi:hypothetical protein
LSSFKIRIVGKHVFYCFPGILRFHITRVLVKTREKSTARMTSIFFRIRSYFVRATRLHFLFTPLSSSLSCTLLCSPILYPSSSVSLSSFSSCVSTTSSGRKKCHSQTSTVLEKDEHSVSRFSRFYTKEVPVDRHPLHRRWLDSRTGAEGRMSGMLHRVVW